LLSYSPKELPLRNLDLELGWSTSVNHFLSIKNKKMHQGAKGFIENLRNSKYRDLLIFSNIMVRKGISSILYFIGGNTVFWAYFVWG